MRSVHSLPGHDEPQVVEVPDLRPGPGQVLIQTLAAAVNPVDVFVATEAGRGAVNAGERLGLGWDVSGRVLQVGDRVTTVAVGDVVAGVDDAMVGANRAQADLVLLDADAVAVVPDGLDPVDAASIPLNSLTAAQAVDLLGDPDGRTLLVTGAGGAVGGYAVALARPPAGTSPGSAARATRSSSARRARSSPRTPSGRRTTRCSTAPCSSRTAWRSSATAARSSASSRARRSRPSAASP